MVTAKTLQQLFNQALNAREFTGNLKNTDVAPVFQKNLPNTENCRPVSVYLYFQKYLKGWCKIT